MEIKATLIDFDRIQRMVFGLSEIDQNKVIKEGLKSATAIFIRAGRANLKSRLKGKEGTNNLMNSFKNKIKRNKLGTLAGFSEIGHHAHLVDSGTTIRTTNKGANRGSVIGNNFWSDAIEANQSEAINTVYIGIQRGIEKMINRN